MPDVAIVKIRLVPSVVVAWQLAVGVAAILFALSFITKRRFGVLGLGLAAGVVIASQFGSALSQIFDSRSMSFGSFSNYAMATIVLVLVPAIVLLFGGPKYRSRRSALISSVAFVILALSLTIEPLSTSLDWLGQTFPSFVKFMSDYQGLIAAVGVIFAVSDMFLSHNPRFKLPKKRSH